ncbi:hypothetical protein QWJ26_39590 [Streptomyces sp. CSDS2]|uniref:hypothetical protein n=1 Tax=Streptomyces sp. CSDS2 TaxID=3055051 RepID=UPI0025B0033D|nr:hypothetical protein [Streptomyces sp. CSDS2]MDN3265795.1 hypothetical protein [Streptomyces sp. CSDS2]
MRSALGGHQHLYAQLILNQDGADAERIWITPSRHTATSVDELAEALAPYGPVPVPAAEVKRWLTAPLLSSR